MTGLIRNNIYAALASAKWIAAAFVVFGIAVGIFDNRTLLIVFSLVSMVGFSLNSMASLRKENTSKWNKHKLTAPLRRKDIVKSYYISQLLWTLAGVILASMVMGLSFLIHGFLFDCKTDIATVFTAGISISLLAGAGFFPLFYLGGEERHEAVLVISLVASVGFFAGLVYLINLAFDFQMGSLWILLSMAAALAVAALAFTLSYFISVSIFRKKQY